MKYLILGAGVAGLTLAHRLMSVYRKDSVLVLEKESEAGGLCRSKIVDDAPMDIGGGHILDVRRPKVVEYLFQFMPREEWDIYVRDSRIWLNGKEISHPIEANIWQMDIENQAEYLESIAKAGCNSDKPMPTKFIDWIYWKLGDKIAADYMIPYNKKMFGDELNQLGTYWLEKLPSVSFRETLLSCLTKKAHDKQPGHAQWYYPKKYGYGEVWLRMADALKDHIAYNQSVYKINFRTNTVTTRDGSKYQADCIIITIPWAEFTEIQEMPENIQRDIQNLKYTSVQTKYFADNVDTKSQWTYFPDPSTSYHRIIYRHTTHDYWRGYWTETRLERVQGEIENGRDTFLNKYAYPLNTLEKPRVMKTLLEWCESKDVYGLGRWGEHQHYNSDLVVELAMQMADRLANKF